MGPYDGETVTPNNPCKGSSYSFCPYPDPQCLSTKKGFYSTPYPYKASRERGVHKADSDSHIHEPSLDMSKASVTQFLVISASKHLYPEKDKGMGEGFFGEGTSQSLLGGRLPR